MITLRQIIIESDNTYLRRIDALEHELFIYLISKRKVDGTKYDHKWAQNICTIIFAWPRLVDNWMNKSKDIKKEIKEYNIGVAANNTTITNADAAYADAAANAANAHGDIIDITTYTANAADIASVAGYWKTRSKALINQLHKVIPSFKYDLYADIDNIVQKKINEKVND
jgi:hypothetical protein